MELKGREADRFLAAPKAGAILLLHGPDTGLVSERSKAFLDAALGSEDDPFARVALDSSDLSGDAQRLADEAHTVALFGGMRGVRLRVSDARPVAAALKPLLATPPEGAVVVIEAGELRRDAALRKLVEKDGHAVAIACYPDEGRALDQVIEETLGKAGLSLDREAATLLKASLGTDRAATRGELEKLSLYAAGTGTVTAEDVAAVVTDAAPSSLDEWLDAMCLSQAEKALAALDRALESGIQPVAIGLAFQRHIMTLHRLAIDIADGKSARGVVDGTRPPIFFRRKAAFTGALERLSETRLRALIKDARTLDLDLRRSPETATARLTLMTLRISRLTRR